MNNEVVTYDDLIEDQDAAIAELLQSDVDGLGPFGSDDVDHPCKGCGEAVPVPKALAKIVDVVYCDDCSKALLWDKLGRV